MAKNILEVNNLVKVFNKTKVVSNISFTLKKGEILGFLGPNGAGKTTTIQMLMGVLTPTSGAISYFGQDFYRNKTKILEKLNFSSTYTSFPADLTTYEILKYTSFFYKISNREKNIADTLELLSINKLRNKRVRNLSEGQKTKVNLAKAFLNKPEILLLDEPTASLDPQSAKLVRDFIIKQQNEDGLSVLFTSHNMPEVEEVCDRIIFIDHGKIIDNASPNEIAKRVDLITLTLRFKKEEIQKAIETFTPFISDFKSKAELIIFKTKEQNISEILSLLTQNNLKFLEISIDKPTLEDYFLKMSSKNNVDL
ncbi:ABC transporter ATP-binding protein [Candidatus Dojkabacteria bacterium]|nr:ABC transporter ATP-binding protein [Candidatus Dojkabacteria bacterium]